MKQSETLKPRLARMSAEGTPALRAFAPWVLDHLPRVAFGSIRSLAQDAGVNPNTVTRLARELGYPGFDAFRADVRELLQQGVPTYGDRARALRNRSGPDVFADVIDATQANIAHMFSAETLEMLESCLAPMLEARRIYAIGARSCYSIAHYLCYVGGMAFENFAEAPSQPGSIVDQLSRATPEDIVVAITFEHYSPEVVRACEIAHVRGARVLALTDSHSAPVAIGAWKVLRLPMAGPQFMPSLTSAFLAVELLLVGMAARSEGAADNVANFETRIREFGGYA